MNLADVMDEMGTALETVDGLRVFPYWADRITPPAAVVAWPDPLTYDATMARGMDRFALHVFVMVGRYDARSTRDRLAQYLDGSGAASIKTALDGGTYTACDVVTVQQVVVDSYTAAGIELLGADFTVEVVGQGS
jgi:hypothetical protein